MASIGLMNPINKFIAWMGVDKFLHLVIGAWVTAQFEMYGTMAVLASLIVVFVLSVLKEFADSHFDWKDIGYGMLGSILEVAYYFAKLQFTL